MFCISRVPCTVRFGWRMTCLQLKNCPMCLLKTRNNLKKQRVEKKDRTSHHGDKTSKRLSNKFQSPFVVVDEQRLCSMITLSTLWICRGKTPLAYNWRTEELRARNFCKLCGVCNRVTRYLDQFGNGIIISGWESKVFSLDSNVRIQNSFVYTTYTTTSILNTLFYVCVCSGLFWHMWVGTGFMVHLVKTSFVHTRVNDYVDVYLPGPRYIYCCIYTHYSELVPLKKREFWSNRDWETEFNVVLKKECVQIVVCLLIIIIRNDKTTRKRHTPVIALSWHTFWIWRASPLKQKQWREIQKRLYLWVVCPHSSGAASPHTHIHTRNISVSKKSTP